MFKVSAVCCVEGQQKRLPTPAADECSQISEQGVTEEHIFL